MEKMAPILFSTIHGVFTIPIKEILNCHAKIGPAGPILAENFAKIGPAGPILAVDRFFRYRTKGNLRR